MCVRCCLPMSRLRICDCAPVLLLGAVLLAGCNSGSGSVAAPTTVATVGATTSSSSNPTTTVYHPSAPQASLDQAGGHLVAAWRAGDRASALSDATPAAVDVVFAQPFPAGDVQARGCANAVAGPSSCTYRILANGNVLDLSVETVTGGWVVSGAVFRS